MRARGIVLTIVVILAALLGWLFHSRFYWVREDIWAGYQGEALDNDFLAAQRLLQRTGHPAACLRGLPAQLPPPGDVLVLPRRSQPMAPRDAARIAAWVGAGGLLLAEAADAATPGSAGQDPLFQILGARLEPGEPSGVTPFTLGGASLKLDLGGNARIQSPGADGAIVRRDLGQGWALLCTNLRCLDNRHIQAFDHADFLCAVAAQRPAGRVWIVTRDAVAATAWGWLWHHAWPALLALAALCLGAVWAAAPRFGPWLPDPDPARRSFLEHLDACGRYQWRTSQGRPLLAASREAFQRRLGLVHPGWAGLEPDQLCQRLAQRSGLPLDRIDRALHHPAAHAAAFLEAVQTLHHLGKNL
jgi:hypothetical protein